MAEFQRTGNAENRLDAHTARHHGFSTALPVTRPPPKRENLFVNLVCNIVVPTLVLTKLSGEDRLGPQWGIIVALAFPLAYGLYDLVRRRKANLFSIIGIASVLLTGGLNQMKADSMWFAVKEAAIPSMLGIVVLISARTKRPLVRELLWNEQVLDTPRVEAVLDERGLRPDFEALLRRASAGLALSFLLSAILNFALARYLLQAAPGTVEFNAQLGKMNALSWPVIVIPTTVVTMFVFWRLMKGMTRLTGLKLEEIFHHEKKKA